MLLSKAVKKPYNILCRLVGVAVNSGTETIALHTLYLKPLLTNSMEEPKHTGLPWCVKVV